MASDYVLSPLNFTGGKYKLLPQILPLFPEKINTFVDIFCGGCNVGVNANAKNIICNDIDSNIIGLMNFFKSIKFEDLDKLISEKIIEYNLSDSKINNYDYYNCTSAAGLGSYNKSGFMRLRNDFNELNETSPNYFLYLYLLIVYSFNNQIRFNKEGNYNLPVGKRDYNLKMQNKLKIFLSNIEKISFTNKSFEIYTSLAESDFVYADPPYLITCATYNEKNGWNETQEKKLLAYLDELNAKKIKFALSNVLTSNGKENNILKEWVEKNSTYTCHHLDFSYKNSNYHKKNISEKTDEVLITNY